MRPKLTFDDILIVPAYSDLESRKKIDIGTLILDNSLDLPIISAAMDTVTNTEVQSIMRDLGGWGIHHRYVDYMKTLFSASFHGPIAVAPSMRDRPYFISQDGIVSGLNFFEALIDYRESQGRGSVPATLSIDVAHGNSKAALDLAEYLVASGFEVMSGNIVTLDAVSNYWKRGVRIFKVGIGPGSACSTRIVSGCGYPQASAIIEISDYLSAETGFSIISDGGCKNSGDIVKALACGADAVILGRLLAGSHESPGEVFNGFKFFRGMASKEALIQANKEVRAEGIVTTVPYTGPLENTILELSEGIVAGFSYVGARDIYEFKKKAEIIQVTRASYYEGLPRE